jgi:hypothetical protein
MNQNAARKAGKHLVTFKRASSLELSSSISTYPYSLLKKVTNGDHLLMSRHVAVMIITPPGFLPRRSTNLAH